MGSAGITTTTPRQLAERHQHPRKPSVGGRGLCGGQGQETARLQEVGERDEQGRIGTKDFSINTTRNKETSG